MKYTVMFIPNSVKKLCSGISVYLSSRRMAIVLCAVFISTSSIGIPDENKNETVLKAVFTDDLKPWIFSKDGILEGVYPAIIIELARELNVKVEIMQFPLKRCEVMMEQGEADLIIGFKDTESRKKYIKFLQIPYRSSSAKVFYVRSGPKVQLNRFEDLYRLRVGTRLGNNYFPGFDENKKIIKDYVNNEEQNFYKLLAGRIDTLIIPEDRGEFLVSVLNIRDKVEKAAFMYPDGSPRYIGISKKSPFIKQSGKFNAAMKRIVKSGTLESLYMKNFFNKFNIGVDSFRWR